jgi:glucose 1-dehydrogenase
MLLKGKVALVTGSATGIGKAIVTELSKQGADIIINYWETADLAQALVKEIQQYGGRTIAIEADVADQAQVNQMTRKAVETLGKIDVLVNNAGIEKQASFLDQSLDEWNRVIGVDLTGPFLCSQAVAKEMVNRKIQGTIINISSVHEEIPFPGYSAYCAAKGGLKMLCRDMAVELAPYRIKVVNVGPGAIATPINERTLSDPKKKSALEKEIPLRRIGAPEEVAKLVAYLASDDAAYITGTTFFIDGGLMRQTGSL